MSASMQVASEPSRTNSAFVFIKPHAVTDKVKDLAKAGLEAKGLRILSQGSLSGEVIDERKLIDQHYYAIASKATILKPHELNVPADKFEAQFGLSWKEALDSGKVFNAMDGCKQLGIDADEMDAAWAKTKAAKKLVKFGGGFYCGLVTVEGKEPVYVFNGFFMSMRSKFTKPGTEIYYYVVEWDSQNLSWSDFRGKVLGPTDPVDAPTDSLRGQILARWQELGLKAEPDVGDNGMHASASPFEALAERNNWLSASIQDDGFGKQLLEAGLAEPLIKAWSVDPQVTITPGKLASIFDQLEDLDVKECKEKLVSLAELNKPIEISAKEDAKVTLMPDGKSKEVEEEAAGDVADPFEMMGGMGEEEVYKVTLMPEGKSNDVEEEAAGDIADPFEMMGGMGEEEVYKVTLMPENEVPADSQSVDPFDIMSRIGGDDVYKVTLWTEKEETATNSAFVFIKPHAVTEKVKKLAKAGLEAKGIKIVAEGSLSGEVIDEKKLIDQHYYAIASKATILKPHELNVPADKFQAQFGISWQEALDSGKVFNAMDGCKQLDIDADEMDAAWAKTKAAKKLVKFGGGFYCGLVTVADKEPVYVFNGFFMSMRSKFTKPGTEIYYYVVEWDSKQLSWSDFRGQVLGPTDPTEAPEESLRGQIFTQWQELGLQAQPDVGDNGMHASASPFEGLAERNNWLGMSIQDDRFGKQILESGIDESSIKMWSVDPQVAIEQGKMGSVFDQLEDLDAKECIAKLQDLFALNVN